MLSLRFKKTLIEDVVSFILAELQNQDCRCGDIDCIRRYFSAKHLRHHISLSLQSARLLSSFDSDVWAAHSDSSP